MQGPSSIHVLSSLQGQAVITFVYEVESNIASKQEEASGSVLTLQALYIATEGLEEEGCGIMAQSKGVRFVEPEDKDYVMERLTVHTPTEQLSLRYKFRGRI